ncbi:acylphosphatase [Marinoscillum furvescens]|uniref:acylphosphatase n=1 Tax=Marinoscillum furvescens DSM 4134 TaxID=1122208 RepID=A0A3D9L6X6_MARFU|nr:acylphosphatase [Marinoscillum furvescens]REE01234.1 acylphosphatase [Marinoscillum furvescens DSM 4134]
MARVIHCHGKVQGVFFRASTKSEADRLGLNGWVRNEADGTVMIHAEGDSQALDALASWAQQGPEYARVDDVQQVEVPDKNYQTFEIRR